MLTPSCDNGLVYHLCSCTKHGTVDILLSSTAQYCPWYGGRGIIKSKGGDNMPSKSSTAKLSGLIKAKRRENSMGLREAAKDSKVSASTLSRLERGTSTSMPDTETLKNLSDWIGVSLSELVNEKKSKSGANEPNLETTEQVEVYLRADKNLSTDSANALASAFKDLYNLYSSSPTSAESSKRKKKRG